MQNLLKVTIIFNLMKYLHLIIFSMIFFIKNKQYQFYFVMILNF